MGRKAKPGEAKAAAGNPGKRPLGTELSAQLKAAGLEPPRGMTAGAKRVWNTLAPTLIKLQFLRVTDTFAFQRYCTYVAEWLDHEKALRARGADVVYETDTRHGKMLRLNPHFIARDRLESKLEKLEQNFGLTTRDRQSLLQQAVGLPSGGLFPASDKPEDKNGDKPTEPQSTAPEKGPLGILAQTRH